MPEFRYPSAAQSLRYLIDYIDAAGDEVSPRDQLTREIQHAMIVIHDPTDCLVVGVGRKLNPRPAALQALELIAGRSYPELTRLVAPQTAQFMDGQIFHGAYGPRLRRQLTEVYYRLSRTPDSRQAVATIWDPALDGDGWADTHDTPCTVYLNFMIRDGKLNLHTHMRSNDVWWGWCYDVTQFCALQVAMAHALGYSVGRYVHVADSFHMYERDFDAASEITTPADGDCELRTKIVAPADKAVPGWGHQTYVARKLLEGDKEWFRRCGESNWLGSQARRIRER